MPTQTESELQQKIEEMAKQAHLVVVSAEPGQGTDGRPTMRFRLGRTADAKPERTAMLVLSRDFNPYQKGMLPGVTTFLAEQSRRLEGPRPDVAVTRGGLPLSFRSFEWPFHKATAGWDSVLVHGDAVLEDGQIPPLHSLVSVAMTLTFLEFIPATEQPYAENFIYNAVLKTFDQGQLELLKNGGLQPVPVTMRYYSRWKKKFMFSETDDKGRLDFLASKVYWLSGALGGGEPVWIVDPRDMEYLDTTAEDLQKKAAQLAADGLLKLTKDTASPTSKLMDRAEEYKAKLERAVEFTKPSFNEDMRAGKTNM